MSNKRELLNKIEMTRELMNKLIAQKNKLADSEIVQLSQELDLLLNKYNQYLRQKD